jgi:hypothetical protein
MDKVTIKVTIGEFTKEYILVETTAPRQYDGHGTLEIYEDSGLDAPRMILVEKDNLAWQEGRNRSGLYTFDATRYSDTQNSMKQFVEDRLYKRLIRNEDN